MEGGLSPRMGRQSLCSWTQVPLQEMTVTIQTLTDRFELVISRDWCIEYVQEELIRRYGTKFNGAPSPALQISVGSMKFTGNDLVSELPISHGSVLHVAVVPMKMEFRRMIADKETVVFEVSCWKMTIRDLTDRVANLADWIPPLQKPVRLSIHRRKGEPGSFDTATFDSLDMVEDEPFLVWEGQ